MLKKILRIAAKIVVGIFIFYLFVCWIALPLIAPWVIRSQGKKTLNTPVKARTVTINPFLWRVNLKDIQVLDAQQQLIAGFDKLSVDVSFLALFKKTLRVESFLLDGLKLNVAMKSDGTINLLSLVPMSAPAAQEESAPAPEEAKELPLILVDDIIISNGRIQFTDESLEPHFSTVLSDMNIRVSGASTRPDARMNIAFSAKLDEKGNISSETILDPFVVPLQMETSFTLDQYAMQVLTPYTGKYTGRTLADGSMTLKMDYRIADNKITAAHKLLIQRFTFGDKTDSKDALNLPFGLAIALLEDPQGRINISLPVKGDMSDPEFEYMHLLGQVARNFFVKLVTKPFSFLASTLGSEEEGTEELGTMKFMPGRADVSPEDLAKIKVLAQGLKERPKLKLEVNGTHDPQADWKAMKTEVFTRDLETLKGESTKAESWVYQQLYERQFGVRELWKLTKAHKNSEGGFDEAALHDEIKATIIEHGEADRLALEELAQRRAQNVTDALLAEGFDATRLSRGPVKETQMSLGFIPLEFTLTVFGEQEASTTENEN